MENQKIIKRLEALRKRMKERNIDYYLIPTADYHNSEYVCGFFKTREFLSGFTGSNGTLVLSEEAAGLWTDGRYFVQAEMELSGTGIALYRMQEEGVPDITEYLEQHMKAGQTLGFDGKCVTSVFGRKLEEKLSQKNVKMRSEDLINEIWIERPALPSSEACVLPDTITGECMEDKLKRVRAEMQKQGAAMLFISKLEDLMWLFNLRGNDIPCNPVLLSYGFLTLDETYFFIQADALNKEIVNRMKKAGVFLQDYHSVFLFLKQKAAFMKGKFWFDGQNTSYEAYQCIKNHRNFLEKENPTELMKAVRNEVERKNQEICYLHDSIAVIRFLYWLKNRADIEQLNEYSAGCYLDQLRAEIPGFCGLSFPTISAYGKNAAMMHYEAAENGSSPLKREGMLLIDSGGQYGGGTTDITRTVALGPVTDEMKKHFTAVAAGMLNLANARFLSGCTGRNLDILARNPLWQMGIDYKCGTGHGIGYMLSVHEGPQNIRWRPGNESKEAVLKEGMIVSDEPGVYLEGEYGIRTENVLEVMKAQKTTDGQFLCFRPLTYVPIDLELIDKNQLTEKEICELNSYHKAVYEKTASFLSEEERNWLLEATKEIVKLK